VVQIVRELPNVACQRERLLLQFHKFPLQLVSDAVLAQPLLETSTDDHRTVVRAHGCVAGVVSTGLAERDEVLGNKYGDLSPLLISKEAVA
jgi:hypothetical protein